MDVYSTAVSPPLFLLKSRQKALIPALTCRGSPYSTTIFYIQTEPYISTQTGTTEEALKRIDELCAAEEEIRGLSAPEWLAARQPQSKPLQASLHEWLVEKKAIS